MAGATTNWIRRPDSMRVQPGPESGGQFQADAGEAGDGFGGEAAEAGDAVAQFELGSLYAKQEVCQCTTVAVG